MKVIKAPLPIVRPDFPAVFMSGSIACSPGTEEPWRKTLANELSGHDGVLYDPVRDDWNDSWENTVENDLFREQVMWELKAMEYADIVVAYFAPGTSGSISLIEFGLSVKRSDVVVCCPDGYLLKGNVETTCRYYNIPFYKAWTTFVNHIKIVLPNKIKDSD